MTTQDRINEDMAQQEYLKQWRIKKEFKKDNKKYYRDCIKHHLKSVWFSFRQYMKASV